MSFPARIALTAGWLAILAAGCLLVRFAFLPDRYSVPAAIAMFAAGLMLLLLGKVRGEATSHLDIINERAAARVETQMAFRTAGRVGPLTGSRCDTIAATDPDRPETAFGEEPRSPQRPFTGKTVLIADDDFEITQTLALRFEQLGMTALRSPDTLHALFGVHKLRPDLVVLDVNMPSGNGLAACEMLNSDRSMSGIPVMVYTSDSSDTTVRRCNELGAHYVLKSPDSWRTIKRLLVRLLRAGVETPTLAEEAALAPAEEPFVPIGRPDRAAAEPVKSHRALAIHIEPVSLAALEECGPALGMSLRSEWNEELGYWVCLAEMPDVVLLGVETWNSAAADVLRRLKANPFTRHLPLLAIVGPDEQGSPRPAIGPTADHVLTSPVDLPQAARALRDIFARLDQSAVSTIARGVADQTGFEPLHQPLRQANAPISVDRISPGENSDSIKEHSTGGGVQSDSPSGPLVIADNGQHHTPQHPRVLVIDDDPDIAQALAMRLSTYGVDVQRAFSGMQGYWTAVESRPNVILCDMRLPEGEGNYIFGRLQTHPLTQNIPVIVITGEDNPGLKRGMLSMGVSAYLNKPIVIRELLTELRRHIPLEQKRDGSDFEDTSQSAAVCGGIRR